MWTDADRATYRQAGDRLPSDLTDPEWGRLGPLIADTIAAFIALACIQLAIRRLARV